MINPARTSTGEGRNHVVFGVPKGEYLPPYFKSMVRPPTPPSPSSFLPTPVAFIAYNSAARTGHQTVSCTYRSCHGGHGPQKDKISDPTLHIVTLQKDDLKKKLKKDGGRFLVICLAPEFLKAGVVSDCREMAPGVPVWAYGNEPSGKYRKEIDAHMGELDGTLVRPPTPFPLYHGAKPSMPAARFLLTRSASRQDGPSILPACKGSWTIPALENMINKAKKATGSGGGGGGGGGVSSGGGLAPSPMR